MNALYIGASGLIAGNQKLSMVAGNMANAASAGYLAETGSFVAFPGGAVTRTGSAPVPIGSTSQGVALMGGYSLLDSGTQSTGNATDLAIQGPGFFVIQSGNGIAYTRDGRFSVNAQGYLVTSGGGFVLGQNGKPIQVGTRSFVVNSGGIITQGGTVLGQLALTNLSAQGMKGIGQNLYQAPNRLPFTGSVVQGALNLSNVSLIHEATQMMAAETSYQSMTSVVNEESNRMKTASGLGVVM